MTDEEKYIRKRKNQAFRLSLLFYLMRIFPIRKRKIVVSTFEGDGGYCCNPRYIIEALLKKHDDLEIVWLTHDVTRSFPKEIKVVKDTPLNTAYHLATAKIWLDNYRKPYGTVKRKGQYYIQTWHATIGFKAVGLYRGDKFPKIARIVSEADSALIDCMVINSEYCRKVYPKKLLYDGYMLKAGSPRVDCLINDKDRLRVELRNKCGFNKDDRIVLYAPTFRGGNQKGKKQVSAFESDIDLNRLKDNLEKKFGGKWRILLRLHPQVSAKLSQMPGIVKNENIRDVSQFPDISEVMAGCDAVITDYSSCAFDAAFAGIPVFLYAEDIQEYVNNRGSMMWERDELPFTIAEDNDELENDIDSFSEDEYDNKVKKFMDSHGVIEDGHACGRVIDYIENKAGGEVS